MPSARPHHGAHPFVFGMTRDQVLETAGRPGHTEHEPGDASQASESWTYPGRQVTVTFDRDLDWRLSSITVSDPSYRVNGVTLIGCGARELTELAPTAGIGDLRPTDDFEELGQCFESDRLGLMLWAQGGRVVNITLFCEYLADGNTPVWPDGRP